MNVQGLKVAVVGGAASGASVALLLARAGAEVTLFERVPTFRAVGAGIGLQPNGLAVLRGLGLEEALNAQGCVLDAPRIADANGRTLLQPKLPNGGHVLMLRRSELQETLRVALERQPGIAIRMGVEVDGARPDGSILLGGRWYPFDLVIGADGVHSRIRDGADFGAKVTRTGISYLRGLAHRELAANEEVWTRSGIFGSFPVRGGTYWFCSMGTPELRAAVEARDAEALRRIWTETLPRVGPLLEEVDSFDRVLVNEVIRVDCERFASGRIVLLGDAAHAMAPNLGQGANSALVDAAVLLEELLGAGRIEEALARYDARRRPAVRWVQDAAEGAGKLSERTGATFRFLRDHLLMPLAALAAPSRVARTFQEAPAELERIAASVTQPEGAEVPARRR